MSEFDALCEGLAAVELRRQMLPGPPPSLSGRPDPHPSDHADAELAAHAALRCL